MPPPPRDEPGTAGGGYSALPASLQKSLKSTATISIAELYTEGQAAAADPVEWPLAQISEILDARTCPLCAWLDGKILKVGTPEYARYRSPSHINCRRTLVAISKDEARTEADFTEPPAELVRKHGHYHLDPDKYAEYKIPAEPAGRHVVVRRVKNLETGERETRLDWAPWHAQTSQSKRDLILKARSTKDAGELKGALEQLGLTDLTDGEQLRAAHRLGLKDRLDGWVTTSVAPPRAVVEVVQAVEETIAAVKTHEIAIAFDADGNEFFRKPGGADYVEFTPDEMASFKDAILTHNHPSGRSFSAADWVTAIRADMQEMRATGINDLGEHHTYTLTRPLQGWDLTAADVEEVLDRIDWELRQELWAKLNKGAITPAEANRTHSHERNLRVAEELEYDYRRIRIN